MSNTFKVPSGINWVASDCNIHTFRINSNGMTVVWAPFQQGTKCTIHRIIECGSQCEDYSNLGGTHALEHFMFKDGACWKLFTRHGGQMNAYTDVKTLATTANLPCSQIFNWLKYQGECMRGIHLANLSPEQVASEINNVLDEMHRNQGADHAARKVLLALQKQCLTQGNTTPTIGLESTLKHITDASSIVKLQRSLLGPSRNTLLVVGQCDPNDFMNSVQENFADIPVNPNIAPLPIPNVPNGKGMVIMDIREKAGATILGLGWPCPAYCKQVDVLKVISEILSPPGNNDSPLTPYKQAGVIFQCGMSVPYSATPDVVTMLMTVPCSAQTEQPTVAKAQMCVVQLLASVLPNFDNQELLDAAIDRIRLGYSYQVKGDSAAVAEAVSEGIKCRSPALHWHAEERFSKETITLEDIRQVSSQILGPSNMCLVRYLQNEIDSPNEFNLHPLVPPSTTNNQLVIDTSMADGFQNKTFQPVSFGILHTRPIAPNNKALCLYAYPGLGRKHNWGLCKVLCSLLNNHCSAKTELSNINYEVKWQPYHEEIVAALVGPSDHMKQALAIFHNKVKHSVFPAKTIDLVKMQTAAIVNGHNFDADLASNINYTNSIYSKDDPSYIVPLKDRIATLRTIQHRHIEESCKHIQQGKPVMGSINMSSTDIKAACKYCGELPAVKAYPAVQEYRADSHKTTIANTPSCKVIIAQPCIGLQATDSAGMANMKIACNVMGNGFGGRLMQYIRDKCGYTYGISCSLVSTSATPSVMVNATFNSKVIENAMLATHKMLDEWIEQGVSQEEFEVSKESLLNKLELHGLGFNYVQGRILRGITTHIGQNEAAMWDSVANAELADVNATLKKYVRPRNFTISIAGSV